MEKSPEFTRFDVMEHLTSENIVRHYLEAMREDGTEDEIQLAEDDARRVCALHRFNPAAVGLTPENKSRKSDMQTTYPARVAVTA